MNVLLVAYSFPPDPLVGSFRAAKVAAAFRAAGHHVDVLTARLPGESAPVRLDEPDLRIHAVRTIPNPRHLYIRLKSLLGRTKKAGDVSGLEGEGASRQTASRWKRLVISMLWLPDEMQGFIPTALARSLPLMKRGVDLVYTTAPPFSDHLVGLALKRLTGARWVAEFRDPWTDNPEKEVLKQSWPAAVVNRWLERQCLKSADQVIAVAEATRELLARKLPPERQDRVKLVLNGIDQIDTIARPRAQNGRVQPFRIVYTGSFCAGRDPRPFLEALAELRTRKTLTADDIQVEFIGSHSYEGLSMSEKVTALGLNDLVLFHDWMPQELARERMREADVLLLLFRDQRIQIPNKLFDYLGARRPILAMVDSGGEAARMLRAAGGHRLVFDAEPASLGSALEELLGQPRTAARASSEQEAVLEEWTTRRQMQKLLDIVAAPATGRREAGDRAAGEPVTRVQA